MKNTITKDKVVAYTPPFRPVYMLSPDQLNMLPAHVIPCFRLNTSSYENFRYHFQEIRTMDRRFMIALDESDNLGQIVQVLMHCMFCENYLFAGNKPVFMFYHGDNGKTNGSEFRKQLRYKLKQQGFSAIIEWDNSDSDPGEGDEKRPAVITGLSEPDNDWIVDKILSDFESLSNYIVFDFPSPREAVTYEKHIALACESWLRREPMLSEGLRKFIAQKNESERLEAEVRKLKQQQASDQKTIDVIRTKYKDDYENLFKWYHNEYEILPMWYKKIGQLIKVIMGKRSFKSLFSDDVKKYKD